jgi:hypothetical protein
VSAAEPRDDASRQSDAVRQEVDLGRYVSRVLAYWWIVVICVVIGIAIGLTRSTTTKATFQASAVVAIGQPLTPSGGLVAGAPQANTALPATILKEQGTQDAATKAAGLKDGALVGHVSTQVVQSSAKSANVTPLVTITVDGPWSKDAVARAANALAAVLVQQTSTYQLQQEKLLQAQLAGIQQRIVELQKASADAQVAIGKLGKTPAEAALSTVYLNVIDSNNSLEFGLRGNVTAAQGSLSLVQEIEMSKVQAPARGRAINAQTKHASLVVSGLLGLLIGVAAALALATVRRR